MSRIIPNVCYAGEFQKYYCPVCGKEIFNEGYKDPCAHLLFSYVIEGGDFEYVAPRIGNLVEELAKEDDPDIDPVEYVLEKVNSESILCFTIVIEGIGCGPVSISDCIAIDFDNTL